MSGDTVRARIILELIGKPKDHVEKSLKEYIKKIGDDKRYTIESKSIKRAKKVQGEMFSVFAELEMATEDYKHILEFCIDYMPASVEVYEPGKMVLDGATASDVANDFLSKLHNIDISYKALKQKNTVLSKSLDIIIQNAILILLNLGPKNAEQISKYVGIKEEQVASFTKILVDEKKIAEEDGIFKLA